jgi:hypothetical protein
MGCTFPVHLGHDGKFVLLFFFHNRMERWIDIPLFQTVAIDNKSIQLD